MSFQNGGGQGIYQTTSHRILKNTTYKFKLWARSLNRSGNTNATIIEAGLSAKGQTLATNVMSVNPNQLKGAPLSEPNDDGGNVWIDGSIRHQFANVHMYQTSDKHPLIDPWLVSWSDYRDYDRFSAWAVSPVLYGQTKRLYGTYYKETDDVVYSEIKFMEASGAGQPAYNWSWPPTSILSHRRVFYRTKETRNPG